MSNECGFMTVSFGPLRFQICQTIYFYLGTESITKLMKGTSEMEIEKGKTKWPLVDKFCQSTEAKQEGKQRQSMEYYTLTSITFGGFKAN